MLVNRTLAPFDNADLRRAMALTLDRKSFIDILGQGEGEIGGALMPPPDGVWGMPPDLVQTLPGYTGDVQKNREEARALIQKAGYGPDKRLSVKISTRNLAVYRDPAAILIDQLKDGSSPSRSRRSECWVLPRTGSEFRRCSRRENETGLRPRRRAELSCRI